MTAPPIRLMLVTDRSLVPLERLPDLVTEAVRNGVDAIQVRERGVRRREMSELIGALRDAIDGRARLIVNGSGRIAEASGADGVHLPEAAPALAPGERHGLVIGRSVHSARSARTAEREGCDYVVVGTVFPSRSHPGGVVGGVELVRGVVDAVQIPVLGIGGITEDNAGDVIRAGASGVAVISAILVATDPGSAAGMLRAAVDAALGATSGRRR